MKIKILLLLVLTINLAFGQNNFKIASYSLSIKGTSNLHDWESKAKEVRANGTFIVDANTLQALNSLEVEIPVKTIKSSKGSIMDGKTYKALEANKYPNINFKLEKATISQKGDKYDVNASGYLTIAGKTNKINLSVQGKTGSDGSVTFSGSQKLKMTDYNIDPPKALLGTLTTGDDVEIVFRITLKPI